MIDLLNFIFMDGWHFWGTIILIVCLGTYGLDFAKVIALTISNIIDKLFSTTNKENK